MPVNLAFIKSDDDGNSLGWEKQPACPNPHGSPDDESVCLCRCGKSKAKPYCDGTHEDVGFQGGEMPESETYFERAERVPGEAVDLLDDESLCIGARFCDVGKSVWNYVEQSGDPDNLAMAKAEACNCPTGRLTLATKDGEIIEPDLPREISAVQDPVRECRGPLWVQGGIEISTSDGEKYEVRNRVTLCRCGDSANQPFCDGTHFNCECMQGLDKPGKRTK